MVSKHWFKNKCEFVSYDCCFNEIVSVWVYALSDKHLFFNKGINRYTAEKTQT